MLKILDEGRDVCTIRILSRSVFLPVIEMNNLSSVSFYLIKTKILGHQENLSLGIMWLVKDGTSETSTLKF